MNVDLHFSQAESTREENASEKTRRVTRTICCSRTGTKLTFTLSVVMTSQPSASRQDLSQSD